MIARRTLLASAILPSMAMATNVPTPLPSPSTRYIGLSLPLTGVQSEVGTDLELGYKLALLGSDSPLRLKVLDDAGDAKRTAQNTAAFVSDPTVIALSGIVGTPHAQAALPVAREGGLPVIGIRSGADSLRDGRPGVVHLRSSFEDELDAIATTCSGSSVSEVVIIHSTDSFGEGSRVHLVTALTKRGITVSRAIPAARDGSDAATAATTAAKIVSGSGKYMAVVVLMLSRPVVEITTLLRSVYKIVNPVFAMSFVATRSVSSGVLPNLTGLSIVSAFPVPQLSPHLMSRQFRSDCEKFEAAASSESLTVFEGWFYGSVIAKSLATTREMLIKKINSGISVYETPIKLDNRMVGYRHTELVYKSSNGRLRK
jgi:branched-chain amino acid transport system substrate-binding protein